MRPKSAKNLSDAVKDHLGFVEAIQALIAKAPSTAEFEKSDQFLLKRMQAAVIQAQDDLKAYLRRIDPIAEPEDVFHPGSYRRVAKLITDELESAPRAPLADITAYYGSGVYALFYRGDHPAYCLIANTRVPIYAGAASPANPRAKTPREQGLALYHRQFEHRESISEAAHHVPPTLRLQDFECTQLVVESGWEVAAESYLIRHYQPVWNKESKVCQGLGKHGDLASTRGNRRSRWDTLHPGREWATAEGNKANQLSEEQIMFAIWRHCLRSYPPEWLNPDGLERVRGQLPPEEPRVAKRARRRHDKPQGQVELLPPDNVSD